MSRMHRHCTSDVCAYVQVERLDLGNPVRYEACERNQARQPHKQLVPKEDRHRADGTLQDPSYVARTGSSRQCLGQNNHCPEHSRHEQSSCYLQNVLLCKQCGVRQRKPCIALQTPCTPTHSGEERRNKGTGAVANGQACKKNAKSCCTVLRCDNIGNSGAEDTRSSASRHRHQQVHTVHCIRSKAALPEAIIDQPQRKVWSNRACRVHHVHDQERCADPGKLAQHQKRLLTHTKMAK